MGTAIHVHPMVREVTEDTPPDLLEGTMDLLVTLPSKKSVRMTVNRRTPMMDLLIQVTTANKINPAGHIVQVKNERGIELPYKPSTPIGILDTTTIDIVPKNQVSEYIIVKKQAKHVNPLFEKTFRLQVHLPRNQLYVMRVGPRTVLQDILEEVCLEKNLDIEKYEIRHPVNLDEKLDLGNRLGDYGLQELTIVSRNSRINSSVSSADIMALQQMEDGRVKGRMDSAFKYSRSSVGDSSVSSESATSGRGISPTRSASDDSRSISPLLPINHPKLSDKAGTLRSNRTITQSMSMDIPGKPKKRAAPAPPPATTPTSTTTGTLTRRDQEESPTKPISKKKEPPREPPILRKQQSLPATSHSRHSSDSSGYHESSNASILSEHPERSIPSGIIAMEPLSSLSRKPTSSSGTNLTSVSSLSSSSLTSSNGGISSRNKRKAPKPPGSSLQAQAELEEEISLQSEASSSSKVNEWNRNSSHQEQEVKVDVHDDLTKEIQSLDSEDEEKKSSSSSFRPPSGVTKSSSSASSLSGRASASGSSSRSSPLPAVDRDGGLEPSSRNATLTNEGDLPLANPNHLSTSIVAQVHNTMEGPGEEHTSSESEASYADSGIPATANVTPSPISLEQDQDIDRRDKDLRSNGSSRRSSIHSNHSGSWRQILQNKVENPHNSKGELSLDSDDEGKKLTDTKNMSNFKLIPPPSDSESHSPDSPIPSEANPMKDEVEGVSSASDEEIKVVLNGAEDSPPPSSTPIRKLSKSESFTHNSEFDVAKMKRKLFAGSGGHNRTSGGITAQMKGNLSSSDEDVRGDDSSNLRFTSMQNLSNSADARSGGRRRGNNARTEDKVFRKATSVVGLETIAPDIAAENPELRQTFQLELEAQFEQWKEQFLQRHLGGSKSGSIDFASNDEQVKKSSPVDETDKTSEEKENLIIQSNENSLSSASNSRVKQEEEFDPEKPQIVHSVSKSRDLKLVAGVELENLTPRSVKQEEENHISSQPQVESRESSQLFTETRTVESDNEMNGAAEPVKPRKQTKAAPENDSQVYRYSGPPAIQMGTWGERPRGAISVKTDTDYIMGMGQNNAGKTGKLGPELRSSSLTTSNSIASRAQTFNGTTFSPTPSVKPTTAGPIQSKWSVAVNTAAPEPTSKNSGSIVSNWKQRMQETELERKQKKEEVKDDPQPPSKLSDLKLETKSASATSTLEKPKPKANFQITSASNTLDRPTFRKTVNAGYAPLVSSQAARNYNEPNLTIESKPSASASTNGLRSVQSFQTIGKDVAKINGSFKANLTDGATLDEKKKFFQGVKPAESPTKEVPLPAVNLKTNIATIQRVFEQRQSQNGTSNSGGNTRASSPALSTSSSSTSLSNSSSSKLPDLIGQNSSSLMLQRVMKTQSFNMDNLRRTPSPQTPSERYTPSPTPAVHTVVDGPVRISTKTNTITNSNGSIQNMGNKAIIIVNGDNNPPTNSISSNFFKQQLKVTAAKPAENINTRSLNNGVKININGNDDKTKTVIMHTTPEPETKRGMVIVHKSESNNKANLSTKPTLKASESFKQPVNKINLVEKSQIEPGKSAGAPPPPPPPPTELSISKNISPTTNGGMKNGKITSPTSPISSDPRAEIFNAISGGNFKLKKTGSTVLLN